MKPIQLTLLLLLAGLTGLAGAESRTANRFHPSPEGAGNPRLERPVIFIPGTMGCLWFAAATTEDYRLWKHGGSAWESVRSLPTHNQLPVKGTICFSPRSAVFAISEDKWLRIYDLHSFDLVASAEFDSQRPITFNPGGTLLMTADLKLYLHLWDLPLLRKHVAELDLDVALKPFPENIPEPLLIEEAAFTGP